MSGPLLTSGLPFLVSLAIGVLVVVAGRPGVKAGALFAAAAVVLNTGLLLQHLSHRFGWGHALLFAVIYYCSAVVLIVSLFVIAVVSAGAVQARRQRART